MSGPTIVISDPGPVIQVQPPDSGPVIELGAEGPSIVEIGIQGPQGPEGLAGAAYVHDQASPSTTWTINHNLGFKPDIALYTNGGVMFLGAITHMSVNQAVVTLAIATAGQARCS